MYIQVANLASELPIIVIDRGAKISPAEDPGQNLARHGQHVAARPWYLAAAPRSFYY